MNLYESKKERSEFKIYKTDPDEENIELATRQII